MKGIIFVLLIIAAMLFFTTSNDTAYESNTQTANTTKKTYHDTPINNYEQRIEAQNIANTIQPSNSYLGSRIDARGDAKESVKQANDLMESRNKALDALTK